MKNLFENSERGLLTYKNIEEAVENLHGVSTKTGLIYSDVFSLECGNKVYIKPENLQVTGAFKIRGAYNKICKLSKEEKKNGIIASSAGNHSQGVAYAAKLLGVNATIVMPKNTPLIKVSSTRSYGANVILHGTCYDEAYSKAVELQKLNNYSFVHPFNDIDVIAGQGTIAVEIIEEIKNIEYILVPIGGGGLISGVAFAAKSINPNIKIIGVEPNGAAAMKKSIKDNKVVSLDSVTTIAEGVAVKTPGDLAFGIIRDYVDDIVTVSDEEIMEAFLMIVEKHKLVSETSGAVSLAGLKKLNVKDKKVACILSGGNIDVVTISSMINSGLVSRGRLFCFSVELPDKPGELVEISKRLADLNANVIGLEHNQFKAYDRLKNVVLEITCETNGLDHINQIVSELNTAGYIVKKVY
ncbi:threonine ammonia-lyase [Clostridium sediminicola]|uniref:threonine ammonia-lyase n=1 Tax=Clostridium sediminicola TaxID=3114879 RepID=UPI0031F2534E